MSTHFVTLLLLLFQPATGTYRDKDAGVEFQVPPGWTIETPTHPGPGETNIQLHDPQQQGRAALYYKVLPNATNETPDRLQAALRAGVEAKIAQRRREGIKTYHLSLERCDARTIAGHAALVCDAEYVQRERAMVEHLVWVRSPHTSALLFARTPAPEAAAFQERLSPIVSSLRIR